MRFFVGVKCSYTTAFSILNGQKVSIHFSITAALTVSQCKANHRFILLFVLIHYCFNTNNYKLITNKD